MGTWTRTATFAWSHPRRSCSERRTKAGPAGGLPARPARLAGRVVAYRGCSDCGIQFPPDEQFKTCPACGEGTQYSALGYMEQNWRARAEAIATRLAKLAAERRFEVPHVDCQFTADDEGLYWLNAHEVLRSGQSIALDQTDHGIITIGPPDPREDHPDDNLFEVIAYSNEKRAYWVRKLPIPDFPC